MTDRKHKIIRMIELLSLALSTNDEEIIRSTIESVIELLKEEL